MGLKGSQMIAGEFHPALSQTTIHTDRLWDVAFHIQYRCHTTSICISIDYTKSKLKKTLYFVRVWVNLRNTVVQGRTDIPELRKEQNHLAQIKKDNYT